MMDGWLRMCLSSEIPWTMSSCVSLGLGTGNAWMCHRLIARSGYAALAISLFSYRPIVQYPTAYIHTYLIVRESLGANHPPHRSSAMVAVIPVLEYADTVISISALLLLPPSDDWALHMLWLLYPGLGRRKSLLSTPS